MDRSFFPYGNKSKEFLLKRTIYLCNYLIKRGVDEIVLACNTLSLLVLDEIKPYFNVKISGVFELFDFDLYKNSLFIGTKNTINEMNRRNIKIDKLILNDLIDSIENDKNIDEIIKKNKDIFDKYPYVLLGCTHFINIKNKIPNSISQDDLYLKKLCSESTL